MTDVGVEAVVCRPALSTPDLAAHLRIRRAVFVEEQGIFVDSDRDARDDVPGVVHLLGLVRGVPCGSVRLYPLPHDDALVMHLASWDPTVDRTRVWQGDRLAVLPDFRRDNVGAPLVKAAVAAAAAAGGSMMGARIQMPNVTFFRRLGWSPAGAAEPYVGLTHQTMAIALGQP